MVAVLLNHGANPAISDKFDTQPLFRAAGLGHTAVVRLLVDAGVNVNAVDKYGHSALHGPSETDDVSVHRILLEHGADMNATSDAGTTPLHRAVDVGKMANVLLLLEYGAKTNVVDNDQNTPLSKAIQRDYDKIAELLLYQPDADVNARNGVAVQEAIFRGKFDLLKIMFERHQVNLNAQGGQFGSAVGAAACNGSEEMLRILLEHGADVNIQGGEFNTALQAAAAYGHAEVLQMLLDHGALVNTPGGRYGCVYRAARRRNVAEGKRNEILKLLEGTGVADVPSEGHHEYERWILTPGGWMWLPTPGHEQSYFP